MEGGSRHYSSARGAGEGHNTVESLLWHQSSGHPGAEPMKTALVLFTQRALLSQHKTIRGATAHLTRFQLGHWWEWRAQKMPRVCLLL